MHIVVLKRILKLGLISIWRHRLRSFLTILGIVFGVCSVISMLAIGEGASYEAQEQIKRLGSQNIILKSIQPTENQNITAARTFMLEYGLTYKDAERIMTTIPSVEVIIPQRSIRSDINYGRVMIDANAIGTVPWFPNVSNRKIIKGRFINEQEMADCKNVCVLSSELASKVFAIDDPIGKSIKVRGDAFIVIGIMENPGAAQPNQEATSNLELYIPMTSLNIRFGDIIVNRRSGNMSMEKVELSQIIVKVKDINLVNKTADIIKDLLAINHKVQEYEIIIPLELLRQAEKTKRIFNVVLGSIAAISLLVGGIGIMNIMLASVTERTREIGIRRALGAKRQDIITQFLIETILLSGSGGVVGLIIGVSIPFLITYFAQMKTIIKLWSLGGAFGISIAIGIVFGIYPAYRAAIMNPITALRHE